VNDIALIWDNVNGRADFAIVNGDLRMDGGLTTPLIISYFCDRLADPSDVIPDGSADPRGWWGDTPPAGATVGALGIDLTGSKLWLASKLQVPATLTQVAAFCSRAAAWMITDGLAISVTPTVTFPRRGWIEISTAIIQLNVAPASPIVLDWSAA